MCPGGLGTRDLGVTPNRETAGAGAANILTRAPMTICMAMCLASGKRLLSKVLAAYLHVLSDACRELFGIFLSCAPVVCESEIMVG